MDDTRRLSDIIVDRCVSKYFLPQSCIKSNESEQILWVYAHIFPVLWSIFRVASRRIWSWLCAPAGYVSVLHPPPRSPGCEIFWSVCCFSDNVDQADVATISWPEIVRRVAAIRDSNPLTAMSSAPGDPDYAPPTAKLDAHDIANRIMRQENYLIALFNKELLDLSLHWAGPLNRWFGSDSGKQSMLLTRALEWNLRFCLLGYLFDDSGRVRTIFLNDRNRATLVDGYCQ